MISRKKLGVATVLAALSVGAVAPHARAQAPTASATAEALFAEGRRLAGEGKFAEACPKFEAAQKVAPTPGTQLNLADCYEKAGRIASAWASFRDAISMSRAAGRSDLVGTAQRRASALEPRLPKLAITVTATASGLEISRDGVAVPREAWTTPVPVDPGEHALDVKAPGRKPMRLTVAAPAEGATATINVPELEIDPDAAAGSSPGEAKGPMSPDERPLPAPSESDWSTQKTVALVVGGVGAVALGVAGVFALTAVGHNEDSQDPRLCDGNRCSPEGKATRDAAIQNGNIATGFALGGLVLGAAATVIFLTAPTAKTRVGIAPSPSGLWLTGSFR